MADEHQELRRINWSEAMSFTHIFKSFRMAIHPSKLLLALAAVLVVYFAGRAMDRTWSLFGSTAQPGDVYTFFLTPSTDAYRAALDQRRDAIPSQVYNWYASSLRDAYSYNSFNRLYRANGGSMDTSGPDATRSLFYSQFDTLAAARREGQTAPALPEDLADSVLNDPQSYFKAYIDNTRSMIADARRLVRNAADAAEDDLDRSRIPDAVERRAAQERFTADRNAARQALWQMEVQLVDQPRQIVRGQGIFAVLMNYEAACFEHAVAAVGRLNIAGGFDLLGEQRRGVPVTDPMLPDPFATAGALTAQPPRGLGVLAWMVLAFYGLVWLVTAHTLFALVFLAVALAAWALFGGAVARIAALHAAREEKISMGQALSFSGEKFLSYFTAPLIPLALILVLGLLLGLGGWLGSLPIGDVIMAVLFGLALLLGGVMAFLSLGLGAGMPLMYPTIAVEGSDAFDAISRSFSYVFGRPWRYTLYTLVMIIYGAICYVFVRFFAFLLLRLTHMFVGRGFFGLGLSFRRAPELAEGATKLDLLWPKPAFDHLAGPMNTAAMGSLEYASSLILHVWVFLVVSLVLAFVLSFSASAYTVIYYLLRRKVDATDLDDVYIEEPGEFEAQAEPAERQPGPVQSEDPGDQPT